MAILNDGNVDSLNNLMAGEDSQGNKLNFKQQPDGTFQADGKDVKRYSLTATQWKASVFDIPEKAEAKPAPAPAPTNVKK